MHLDHHSDAHILHMREIHDRRIGRVSGEAKGAATVVKNTRIRNFTHYCDREKFNTPRYDKKGQPRRSESVVGEEEGQGDDNLDRIHRCFVRMLAAVRRLQWVRSCGSACHVRRTLGPLLPDLDLH